MDSKNKARNDAYNKLSGNEKFKLMMQVLEVSYIFNGCKPLKEPQGKGVIFNKH
ncbi:MAG: hypothetical protein SGJ10_10085 [Bacteroidota bacterium]|nr:hypothetical protein [Bacteroidota bacterium]